MIDHLVDGYRSIHHGRLIVLGEPGAGKTVLAILLTLGLLRVRAAGGAVPVVLAISQWDPIRESLDHWVIRTLADAHYVGRSDIPRRLLNHRLLLPILDGLDEMPEAIRRSAIGAINRAIGADRPIVVTCRSVEYADVIADGAPTLRQAVAVRVHPLPPEDVVSYLRQLDWPHGTVWDEVYADMLRRSDGPVASALSTPLMVALARTVYQRLAEDPAELLDPASFDCRHAVEDHLTDKIIDASYAPNLLPSSGLVANPARSQWSASQARRYLTYLAAYLHRYQERDLAWWQLSKRLLPTWVAPGIGLAGGLIAMASVAIWIKALDHENQYTSVEALAIGAGFGLVFTVLAIVVWYTTMDRAPGRISVAIQGSTDRLRQGFVSGAASAAIIAAPGLLILAVINWIGDGWPFSAIATYAEATMGALAIMTVVGSALAVHSWLNAPPQRANQVSPDSLLSQDRRSSWVAGVIVAAVVSVITLPVLTLAVVLGNLTAQAATGWPGWPGELNIAPTVSREWYDATGGMLGPKHGSPWMAAGVFAFFPGALLALLMLISRAWFRFTVTRLTLTLRRRLPWRLLSFLSDARNRQLLRQSSGVYQFRHIRLQERLAARGGYAEHESAPSSVAPARGLSTRYRRIGITTIAVILACLVVIIGKNLPQDTAAMTIANQDFMQFSPDGQILATAGSGSVQLWKVSTKKHFATLPGHNGAVKMAFSHNGQILATTGADDRTIRLWTTIAGTHIATLETNATPAYMAFSPDDHIVATSSKGDKAIILSNTANGEHLATLTGQDNRPAVSDFPTVDLRFSPDGDILYSTGINVVYTGDQLGSSFVENSQAWRTSGERITSAAYPAFDVVSPDGRTIATVSGAETPTIQLRRITTNEIFATIPLPDLGLHLRYSPDGRSLAILTEGDQRMHLWDAAAGKQIAQIDNTTEARFSPDGQVIVTANNSGITGLRTASTGKLVATINDNSGIWSNIEFGPGGRVILATRGLEDENGGDYDKGGPTPDPGYDYSAHIWEAATGAHLASLAHGSGVVSAEFSPNGQIVATTGYDDDGVRLWDTTTGTRIASLIGHAGAVKDVSYNSDGHFIATAGMDHTIRVWNTQDFQ